MYIYIYIYIYNIYIYPLNYLFINFSSAQYSKIELYNHNYKRNNKNSTFYLRLFHVSLGHSSDDIIFLQTF